MFGIGGKKKAPARGGGMPSQGQMRVPVDEVNALSSRGFSEPEIVNALKKQGYSIPEIDQGMKGALRNAASTGPDMGSPFGGQRFDSGPEPMPRGDSFQPPPGMELEHPFRAGGGGFEEMRPARQPFSRPTFQEPSAAMEEPSFGDDFNRPVSSGNDFDIPTGSQFEDSVPTPREYQQRPEPRPLPSLEQPDHERKVSKKQIEELVEVIIEEKWHDMKSKLIAIDTKFLETNNKIVALENMIRQMRSEREDELKHIDNKIDSYKGSMNDMNGKMQSMENAMRDSLTPLIGTLRSLSETINNIKEKKGL
ncbi:MAG: hypothetical protein JW716_01715 [Candidatus Aenigmarchaeota archaeon]|nr:hypothetical protein [Candidatus Aenigmarchaeota archaeon]